MSRNEAETFRSSNYHEILDQGINETSQNCSPIGLELTINVLLDLTVIRAFIDVTAKTI